jgi:hypothetical protein
MNDIYGQRMDRGVGAGGALALVVLGVAAGAVATLLIASANKEKISLGNLSDANPREWLAKTAKALQRGRDRLISAVEDRAGNARS